MPPSQASSAKNTTPILPSIDEDKQDSTPGYLKHTVARRPSPSTRPSRSPSPRHPSVTFARVQARIQQLLPPLEARAPGMVPQVEIDKFSKLYTKLPPYEGLVSVSLQLKQHEIRSLMSKKKSGIKHKIDRFLRACNDGASKSNNPKKNCYIELVSKKGRDIGDGNVLFLPGTYVTVTKATAVVPGREYHFGWEE